MFDTSILMKTHFIMFRISQVLLIDKYFQILLDVMFQKHVHNIHVVYINVPRDMFITLP